MRMTVVEDIRMMILVGQKGISDTVKTALRDLTSKIESDFDVNIHFDVVVSDLLSLSPLMIVCQKEAFPGKRVVLAATKEEISECPLDMLQQLDGLVVVSGFEPSQIKEGLSNWFYGRMNGNLYQELYRGYSLSFETR